MLSDLFVEHRRHPFARVRRLLQHASPTPVGLLTGWQLSAEVAKREGFAPLLPKPFDLDLLLTEIAAGLHQTLTPEQERQFHTVERFVAALDTRNREALLPLLAEDFTCYSSFQALTSSVTRIQGMGALFTYVVETLTSYQRVSFDEFTFHPRPRGWVMRYSSHWPTSDGSRQSLTGALLFHFRGEHIHQLGIQWNDRRLQVLMAQQQGL